MAMLDNVKMKRLRKKLKMTQQQAADASGMRSAQMWNDYENGRRANASIERLGEIAKALGVKPGYLIKE